MMKTLKKIPLFISMICLLGVAFMPQVNAQTIFEAYLSGSNEAPAITSTSSGWVTATLTDDTLVVEGSFEGLTGDYAGSHIHTGMAGQAGGVLVALTPSVDGDNRGGTFAAANNTFGLTPEQVDMLMMQGLYVNVHSGSYAAGEIRGQIVPEADMHFRSNFSGAYEIPGVKTMANGGIVLQLRGDSLFVSGSFQNLADEFDAEIAGGSHLHTALAGSNGSIALNLTATVSSDKLSGSYYPSDNAFELTADQKNALLNRMFYVNIHTKAFASGELRGQVVPQSTATFFASLSGTAEAPSIQTGASGAVVLELHNDTVVVTGSFANLEGDFDASIAGGSHLHIGHSGQNGNVSILINADVEANLKSGAYQASENMFEVTPDQIAALMARMMYVNIHTTTFGAGELRGQVLGEATSYFKTSLSGIHEVDPIWTPAYGALTLEVNGMAGILTGSFSGLSSSFDASIAGGAHLHSGSVSANGDVAVLINTTAGDNDTSGVYEAGMNWLTFTEDQLNTLYEEGMYANIHTTGFAGGELRGQLLFGDNMYPDSSEITSPNDGSTLVVGGDITTMFEATWSTASDANGNDLAYIWQLATDAEFGNIIVNINVGSETSFMTDYGTLDSILSGLGVEIGSTATVYHRVIVTDGSNETVSQSKSATLERGMITPNEGEQTNPEKFGLDQNYPNPFNPTTNISFTLSENSVTSLKVFNMLGQEVATLVNELLSSGTHTYTFNAGNLSSGIYMYRLSSGGQTITKRMMLIK